MFHLKRSSSLSDKTVVVRLELLPVHFALADEVLQLRVVDGRDEEEGRAVGGEVDGRVNPNEEKHKSMMLLCTDVQCTTLIICHISHAVHAHL